MRYLKQFEPRKKGLEKRALKSTEFKISEILNIFQEINDISYILEDEGISVSIFSDFWPREDRHINNKRYIQPGVLGNIFFIPKSQHFRFEFEGEKNLKYNSDNTKWLSWITSFEPYTEMIDRIKDILEKYGLDIYIPSLKGISQNDAPIIINRKKFHKNGNRYYDSI